jgi:hypothetical protein
VNNARLLTIVQFVCIAIWLVGMIATFASGGPARWIWLVLWALAMIVFFASLWRVMWLRSDPVRQQKSDDG